MWCRPGNESPDNFEIASLTIGRDVIGEGANAGALALGVADPVLMPEHAIYSVISPEGAAAILYRDASRAEAVSEVLKLTGQDPHKLGIIDAANHSIIPVDSGDE